MQIGVLTLWQSKDNYGQMLQCYALQQFLREKGHEPCLISYRFIKEERQYTPLWKMLLKVYVIYPLVSLLGMCVEKRQLANEEFEKYQHEKKRNFEDFLKKNIMRSEIYNNLVDLQKNPPIADCYIVGSDQVWAQLLSKSENSVFFLDFGDEKTKRIAYAASFSMSEYPENLRSKLAENLSRLNVVSVRETQGIGICNSVGTKATKVVDPTLLLGTKAFENISAKRMNSNQYAFVYQLNIASPDEIRWTDARAYCSEKHWDMIATASSGYFEGREILKGAKYVYPSIPEWLSLIRYSEIVITTSFHGIVFSILFRKNFVYVPLKGIHSGGNARVLNLLSDLQIEEKCISDGRTFNDVASFEIDYSKCNQLLKEKVAESSSFLLDAINS